MIGILILFNKLGRVYKEEPDNMMKEVLAHQPEQVPLPDPAIVSIISSFFQTETWDHGNLLAALRAALARWSGPRSGESGTARRVESRQGNISASCFSSRQAGVWPISWMAAFKHASPWPWHPVSRQVWGIIILMKVPGSEHCALALATCAVSR